MVIIASSPVGSGRGELGHHREPRSLYRPLLYRQLAEVIVEVEVINVEQGCRIHAVIMAVIAMRLGSRVGFSFANSWSTLSLWLHARVPWSRKDAHRGESVSLLLGGRPLPWRKDELRRVIVEQGCAAHHRGGRP
jgi:hypothetical protein